MPNLLTHDKNKERLLFSLRLVVLGGGRRKDRLSPTIDYFHFLLFGGIYSTVYGGGLDNFVEIISSVVQMALLHV